jgi:hypothetical protein
MTTREEKRRTRMATEGTAFLLASLRSQAQPPVSTAPSAPDRQSPKPSVLTQSQSTSSNAHEDEFAPISKIPRLEETVSVVEETAMVKRERPTIHYDFTKPASLLCVETACFADSTLDFKFSSKIQFNNYLKACKWSPNGELLLTSSEDRKTRTFRLNEQDQQAEVGMGVWGISTPPDGLVPFASEVLGYKKNYYIRVPLLLLPVLIKGCIFSFYAVNTH